MSTAIERISAKIAIDPAGCWEWTGARNADGYGVVAFNGGRRLAHRTVFTLAVGPIPAATPELDHLCRVRHCVNPAHLEPVTRAENVRRANGAGSRRVHKTHCPSGHPYEGANVRINPSGSRTCRTCDRMRTRVRRAAVAA